MKCFAVAVGCALGTAGCIGGPPPPAPLNPVRFLLISDIAGGDTLSDSTGGLARVATVRRRIADEGPVLFVAAGNALASHSPSPRQARVEALNAAKLDYATFGADELMLPQDTLRGRIAASQFKWLSSNCTVVAKSGETPIPQVLPWDTVRVSTHKVGIFGLTMAGKYASQHSGDDAAPYVRCSNPDSAAFHTIDTLVARGAELIVALTHRPTEDDRNLLLRESRLDLILGGYQGKAQTMAIAGRYVLKADPNARTAQFVTLWGGKDHWQQAVGLVPINARLPADTAVTRAQNTNPD